MSDEQATAPSEAVEEVVQTEVEQTEAPEAVESTQGQIDDQPAEADGEPKVEEVSASKQRRERRKAELERLRNEVDLLAREKKRVDDQLAEIKQAKEQEPPKFEDFTDPDDYVAAKAAYASMKMFDDRKAKSLEKEAGDYDQKTEALERTRAEEALKNWDAQKLEAKDRYADFEEVTSAPDVAITKGMFKMIAMSDVGADVAYHLGMNKDIARVIAGMNPDQQQGAMAMLERHVSVSTPRTKTKTDAPEPVTPVRPKAVGSKDPAKMSMAEYKAAREAGKI